MNMTTGGRQCSLREMLPLDWQRALAPIYDLEKLTALDEFLEQEARQNITVYPPYENIFNAFKLTPFAQVRALILGQDPYHEPGQACGLAFSVPEKIPMPASLRNILKEYQDDTQTLLLPGHSLVPWAKHGVLLLNTVLTVRQGLAFSHQKKGWEEFTDAVIRALSAQEKPVAFILWGAPAQKKLSLIDNTKHIIHCSAHPSPLSVYRGFFGSKPFSTVNAKLVERNCQPIDWSL